MGRKSQERFSHLLREFDFEENNHSLENFLIAVENMVSIHMKNSSDASYFTETLIEDIYEVTVSLLLAIGKFTYPDCPNTKSYLSQRIVNCLEGFASIIHGIPFISFMHPSSRGFIPTCVTDLNYAIRLLEQKTIYPMVSSQILKLKLLNIQLYNAYQKTRIRPIAPHRERFVVGQIRRTQQCQIEADVLMEDSLGKWSNKFKEMKTLLKMLFPPVLRKSAVCACVILIAFYQRETSPFYRRVFIYCV